MRLALLASLLLLGACGATPRSVPTIANRAPLPPRPTCDLPAIADYLRARWQVVGPVEVDCTPGRFPAPGFFVEARAGEHHQIGILDAGTFREVAPFVDEARRPDMVTTIQRASADLDGDGVDEIVETWRNSAHAHTGIGNRVVVRHVHDRRLSIIAGPHVAIFHPGLGGCWAEARVEPRGVVVTVEHVMGIPPSDCLEIGVHHFVLERGSMRPVARRR